MSPDIARRATEPFLTTKELGCGTGLRLSVVTGFVEQSGGQLEMEMETRAGEGITIRMVFPRVA